MFYNPNTGESAERRDLCRRFNMSIHSSCIRFLSPDEEEWFAVDEAAPDSGEGYYFVRTDEVEAREDGTYGVKWTRVDNPSEEPQDETVARELSIEDRVAAIEDGIAELAELIVEVVG